MNYVSVVLIHWLLYCSEDWYQWILTAHFLPSLSITIYTLSYSYADKIWAGFSFSTRPLTNVNVKTAR